MKTELRGNEWFIHIHQALTCDFKPELNRGRTGDPQESRSLLFPGEPEEFPHSCNIVPCRVTQLPTFHPLVLGGSLLPGQRSGRKGGVAGAETGRGWHVGFKCKSSS